MSELPNTTNQSSSRVNAQRELTDTSAQNLPQPTRRRWSWRSVGYWGGFFLAWVLGLILIGGGIGAIVFPLGGLFIETNRTPWQLAINGARFLSFIFMIWAPAVSLVACTMKAWRRNAFKSSSRTQA